MKALIVLLCTWGLAAGAVASEASEVFESVPSVARRSGGIPPDRVFKRRVTTERVALQRRGGEAWERRVYDAAGELVRIERLDERLQIVASRHQYVLAGVPRWTSWLEPEAQSFPTEVGVYRWSYDPEKWKPWTGGYLWDMHKGWLWRGYRDAETPGERLTPSEGQASHYPGVVESYYLRFPYRYEERFDESNSHWLSPLDKWGVWASRRMGQVWWWAPFWEGVVHHTNLAWGGYCNGSAAATLLAPRPRESFVDRGIRFDPRDVAGILQASLYSVEYRFFGQRYNGPAQDLAEPSPVQLVHWLRSYLEKNGTPLVVDEEADEDVGNVVVLGAELRIEPTSQAGVRRGTLTLTSIGNEEDTRVPQKALAELAEFSQELWVKKAYYFDLHLAPDGRLLRAVWDDPAKHPDFAWLPTAWGNDWSDRNPYIPHEYVRELLEKSRP